MERLTPPIFVVMVSKFGYELAKKKWLQKANAFQILKISENDKKYPNILNPDF